MGVGDGDTSDIGTSTGPPKPLERLVVPFCSSGVGLGDGDETERMSSLLGLLSDIFTRMRGGTGSQMESNQKCR